MEQKRAWLRAVQKTADRYLTPENGFNGRMSCRLAGCCYAEQSVTFAFETQRWQCNDRGEIHGGAIAGMFDTAFGVVAYITAGGPVTSTAELSVSFLRSVAYGTSVHVKVIVLKAGRSLIRQRAELTDAATGSLLAVAGGCWTILSH
ncbi:MAG: PaaI family thioesterase [Ruminococcaceae bacterium]|nr:PaaI family thioesterase [Oscillospiraceae bacterium]